MPRQNLGNTAGMSGGLGAVAGYCDAAEMETDTCVAVGAAAVSIPGAVVAAAQHMRGHEMWPCSSDAANGVYQKLPVSAAMEHQPLQRVPCVSAA